MRLPARIIQAIKSRVLGPLTGSITRIKTQAPTIALTFDDGPHPQYTPQVLDLLRNHNAKATFFVVGKAVEQYPDIIQRILAEGHALGNHTHTHVSMPNITRQQRRGEVRACARAVGPQPTKLFRPPWGHQSRESRRDLLRLGYHVIMWDVIVEDWLKQEPEKLAHRIVSQAKSGSIVLLHDAVRPTDANDPASTDRTYMIDALSIALPKLASQFRLATVPTMLKQGRPIYRDWYS